MDVLGSLALLVLGMWLAMLGGCWLWGAYVQAYGMPQSPEDESAIIRTGGQGGSPSSSDVTSQQRESAATPLPRNRAEMNTPVKAQMMAMFMYDSNVEDLEKLGHSRVANRFRWVYVALMPDHTLRLFHGESMATKVQDIKHDHRDARASTAPVLKLSSSVKCNLRRPACLSESVFSTPWRLVGCLPERWTFSYAIHVKPSNGLQTTLSAWVLCPGSFEASNDWLQAIALGEHCASQRQSGERPCQK